MIGFHDLVPYGKDEYGNSSEQQEFEIKIFLSYGRDL